MCLIQEEVKILLQSIELKFWNQLVENRVQTREEERNLLELKELMKIHRTEQDLINKVQYLRDELDQIKVIQIVIIIICEISSFISHGNSCGSQNHIFFP